MMDREMLEEYQRRWEMVAEREAMERRKATLAQRWMAFNSLLRMARALGVRPQNDDREDEVVRERWKRLREMHESGLGPKTP